MPHPPLYLACTNPATVRLAAAYGVGPMILGFGGPEAIAEVRKVFDEACATRDLDDVVSPGYVNNEFVALCPSVLMDDREKALQVGARAMRFFAEAISHWSAPNGVAPTHGTENVAVVPGTFEARFWGGGGLTIFLIGDDGNTYVYMHLLRAVGDARHVEAGELIALTGATTTIAKAPPLRSLMRAGIRTSASQAPVAVPVCAPARAAAGVVRPEIAGHADCLENMRRLFRTLQNERISEQRRSDPGRFPLFGCRPWRLPAAVRALLEDSMVTHRANRLNSGREAFRAGAIGRFPPDSPRRRAIRLPIL